MDRPRSAPRIVGIHAACLHAARTQCGVRNSHNADWHYAGLRNRYADVATVRRARFVPWPTTLSRSRHDVLTPPGLKPQPGTTENQIFFRGEYYPAPHVALIE